MPSSAKTPLVLILCTGNSCRSQMAAAFLERAAAGCLRVASAGSEPKKKVHKLAIETMKEKGFDLSSAKPRPLEDFLDQEVETVITVCGYADEKCPVFPGQLRRYHLPFDDPAEINGSKRQKREVFRRVRDEIDRVFSAYGMGRRDSLEA